MIFFRKIVGKSMLPTLQPGQIVVCLNQLHYKIGDIVVVRRDDREVIKRIKNIRFGKYWLVGDNELHSSDSRSFGAVDKSDILGVMKYTLAQTTPAPKLRDKRGAIFGIGLAIAMIALAVLHLFRIDTFVPELTLVIGDRTQAMWLASLLVIMEVFAIPFLLRMPLSKLARYFSGAFVVAVPLFWTLVAIWMYGSTYSTAQLGEFVSLPSSSILIIINLLWTVFAYYTVWALGYDNRPGQNKSFAGKWLSKITREKST